jgi:hypothetical protein
VRSRRKVLRERVALLSRPAVVADVDPFLNDPCDLQLLERQVLLAERGRGGAYEPDLRTRRGWGSPLK